MIILWEYFSELIYFLNSYEKQFILSLGSFSSSDCNIYQESMSCGQFILAFNAVLLTCFWKAVCCL